MAPYFRLSRWHATDDACHHTSGECFYAGMIDRTRRRLGDGGKPLCALCRRLDRAEHGLDREAAWLPQTRR